MKRMSLVCCLCVAATFAYADEENADIQGEWLADKKNGCQVWIPDSLLSNVSISWSGACKDGKADGKGTLKTYENEELSITSIGIMENGELNGKVTVIYSSGHKYVGDIKHSSMNGNGELTWPEGSKYIGEVKDGLPHGKGVAIEGGRVTYSGNWFEGKIHGRGRYTARDGTSYEGLWDYGTLIKKL